jgi:hypothetical protein
MPYIGSGGEYIMKKEQWFTKQGFNESGQTYCILGEDTYAIKDYLKLSGCKYSLLLKWHTPTPINLPADYQLIPIDINLLGSWDEKDEIFCYSESAQEIIDKKIKESAGPSLSEYIGKVGERIRYLTAVYKSSRGYNGYYGWCNIYTFYCGKNCLVWMTSKELDIPKGTVVDLVCTVIKHEEFRGVKTTRINRCIITPID